MVVIRIALPLGKTAQSVARTNAAMQHRAASTPAREKNLPELDL
jgi:hypothetical protein